MTAQPDRMKWATKLSIGGVVCEFVDNSIKGTDELILDEEGVRGTRSMIIERATQGQQRVSGDIKMNPTPLELSGLWPFIAQGSTGDTLTDAMQDVTVIKDTQTTSESYSGRFSKFKFEGSPGKKMDLTLSFLGYSYTMGSGGVVSGTPDITNSPYMMSQTGSGVTIGGTAYLFDKVSLEVDNKIEPTFMQGRTATDLMPTGREVTLTCSLKYTSIETGLLATAQAGPVLGTPVAGSIAWTNGTNSATFTFAAMIATPETVEIVAKKLRLPLTFKCLRVGSSLEVVAVFV